LLGGQMNIPALCVYYYPPAVRATVVAAKLQWSELFLLAATPALVAASPWDASLEVIA